MKALLFWGGIAAVTGAAVYFARHWGTYAATAAPSLPAGGGSKRILGSGGPVLPDQSTSLPRHSGVTMIQGGASPGTGPELISPTQANVPGSPGWYSIEGNPVFAVPNTNGSVTYVSGKPGDVYYDNHGNLQTIPG